VGDDAGAPVPATPGVPVDFAAEQARFDERVLRAFVREGRLTSIPAQERKRQVILRWLLEARFPDDGPWVERDVNMRLALVHFDVAALRRYLVDAGLMTRAGGVYLRATPATKAAASADPADPRGDREPGEG
jgi:hypothetical protein